MLDRNKPSCTWRPCVAAAEMMKIAVYAVPMMPMKLMMRKWRKDGIMEKLNVRMAPHIKAHTLRRFTQKFNMIRVALCFQQKWQMLCCRCCISI